jgi:hypothetical protein
MSSEQIEAYVARLNQQLTITKQHEEDERRRKEEDERIRKRAEAEKRKREEEKEKRKEEARVHRKEEAREAEAVGCVGRRRTSRRVRR